MPGAQYSQQPSGDHVALPQGALSVPSCGLGKVGALGLAVSLALYLPRFAGGKAGSLVGLLIILYFSSLSISGPTNSFQNYLLPVNQGNQGPSQPHAW